MTEPDSQPVVPLTDEEILLRQVHPRQMQRGNGKPDSSAFLAKAAHGNLLSTRRAWVGSKRAFDDWLTGGRESVGTYGISVDHLAELDLGAFDDSSHDGMPEGHASVDFRGTSQGLALKKARILRDRAVELGRLHPPSEQGVA